MIFKIKNNQNNKDMETKEPFDLTKYMQKKINKVREIGRKKGMTDEEINQAIALGSKNATRGMFYGPMIM